MSRVQARKMTCRLRNQLSKLVRPDYQHYPCCRLERCHYNHRLDYPLLFWYTIALYHFLRDWTLAPYQLELSPIELFAWLIIYLLVIVMQALMFRKFVLPLIIPPATSLYSTCNLVVKREIIPRAKSFLRPCHLVVEREVRLVSHIQSLPQSGQAF